MHRVTLIFKLIHKLVPSYICDLLPPLKVNCCNINLTNIQLRPLGHRNPHNLDIKELVGSNQYCNSPLGTAINEWNRLDNIIKDAPNVHVFKNELLKSYNLAKHRYYDTGRRDISCYYAQLRFGVNSLKHSLYMRNLDRSNLCDCTQTAETVQHFLLHCPKYELARDHLYMSIAQAFNVNLHNANDNTRMKVLLETSIPNITIRQKRKLVLLIHSYIKSTRRFK